mgnify:CR=1 FL=1
MTKTVDRYIFKELLEPFLFGLGSFTIILSAPNIIFNLVTTMIQQGMPLLVAIQIFVYRLPSVVIYIFPMATLLAALMAFSRLSHDSEIIAFRASGISLFRLMVPVVALGVLSSLVNLGFSEIVVPEANKAAKNLLVGTSVQRQPKMQKNVFVPEMESGKLKRIFYAETMTGATLEGVIVQEFSGGHLAQIINAANASWRSDKNQWLFKNGIIYLIAESGEYKHLIKFDEQYISIKYTPADFYIGDKSPDDMNLPELREFIALKEKMGVDVTEFKIKYHMKLSIPFASLVFALLGAPLGISPRRASGAIGLGFSMIIIFFYYVAISVTLAMGQSKLLAPEIAAWAPNIIAGAAGLYILKKASEQ